MLKECRIFLAMALAAFCLPALVYAGGGGGTPPDTRAYVHGSPNPGVPSGYTLVTAPVPLSLTNGPSGRPDLFYVMSTTYNGSGNEAVATNVGGNYIWVGAGATLGSSNNCSIRANAPLTVDNYGTISGTYALYGPNHAMTYISSGNGFIQGRMDVGPNSVLTFNGSRRDALNGDIFAGSGLTLSVNGGSNQNLSTNISAGAGSSVLMPGVGDLIGNISLGANSLFQMTGYDGYAAGSISLGTGSTAEFGHGSGHDGALATGANSTIYIYRNQGANNTGATRGTINGGGGSTQIFIGAANLSGVHNTGSTISNVNNITLTYSGSSLTTTASITLTGTLTVNAGTTFTSSGSLTSSVIDNIATFASSGNINNSNGLTNSGNFIASAGSKSFGSVSNSGTFNLSGGTVSGGTTFVNNLNCTVNMTNGTLDTFSGGITNNYYWPMSGGSIGTNGASTVAFTNAAVGGFYMTGGSILGSGTLTNLAGFTGGLDIFNISGGTINKTGSIVNSGSFSLSGTGIITGAASFTNNSTGNSLNGFSISGGTYSLTGFFKNEVGGKVTIASATFSPANPGNASYNKGTIIVNSAGIYNQPAGTYINSGTVTLNGTGKVGGAYSSSSITNVNGTNASAITGIFTGLPGSVLNIGNTSAPGIQALYTMTAAINNVESIFILNPSNISPGSVLSTNGNAITGIKTILSVASRTTANINSAVSGVNVTPRTAIISNAGTMNFATGSSLANFLSFDVLTGGAIVITANGASIPTPVVGAVGNTNTSFTVNPGVGNSFTTSFPISNIRTVTVSSGTFNIVNPISGVDVQFVISSGTFAVLTSSVTGAGTVQINGGELRFNPGGSVASFSAINVATNSIITVNRADTPAPATLYIPIVGALGNTGTVLSVNPGNGNTFTPGSTVADIRTIEVISGNMAIVNTISGVNTAFNITPTVGANSSASLTTTLSGTGTLNLISGAANNPTINFNADSSISGFSAFNVNTRGIVNINRGGSPIPMAITGVGGNTSTSVNINPISNTTTFTTAAGINDIRTITVSSGTANITFPLTGINTGFNVSSGARATLSNTLSGTGAININGGTIDFNNGSGVSGPFASFNVATNGTVNVNNTGFINMALTGVLANTGSTLNLNPDLSYTTAGTITDIRNINVLRGVFNINNAVTGVDGQLKLTTGTINVNAALRGAGTIINSDTINFNLANNVDPTNFSGFSSISAQSGSVININENITLPPSGTNIIGTPGNANTFLNINNSKTLDTANIIQDIRSIIITDGSSLALSVGAVVSGFNDFNIATNSSTLVINSGAQFSVGPGDNIYGDGSIDNYGVFTINGSNLTLGGNFVNQSSGVFKINGTPTLTFNGPIFTNTGQMVITFSEENTLPTINIRNVQAPSLQNGVIVIGYNRKFIAAGTYPFLATGDLVTPPALGGVVKPEPSTFISGWDLDTVLTPDGYNVVVRVTRNGYGSVATDPVAKLVGNYLELLGRSPNLSDDMLALLNYLEGIDNVADLNTALLDLVSPEYLALQSLAMTQTVLGSVQSRIVEGRAGFASGDIDRQNAFWIRPFRTSSTQKQKGNLLGYHAHTNGYAFGMDSQLTPWFMLGAGGSVSGAKVTDRINVQNQTQIKSYQALIYGTFESKTYAYLDWVLSTGVNRYSGVRTIRALNTSIYSKYSGQQFSVKAIASKNYIWQKYYQLTPLASAQYTFLRQLAYRETDGGDFSRIVNPNNVNLLQLGVGGQISVPFAQGKITSIPEFHVMFLADAKGGEQDNNSQFVSGGPVFSTTVKSGRLITRIGASYSFAIGDSVQIVANYDLEARRKYYSNEFFLNLKYVF